MCLLEGAAGHVAAYRLRNPSFSKAEPLLLTELHGMPWSADCAVGRTLG